MANKRIFYASHAIKVGASVAQGVQSVAVNTNFNLEQVFQLGRLAIYDNIPADPDVEVTISKVLDGRKTIWNLATAGGGSLVSNANKQTTLILGVGDDTADAIAANTSSITMTGCYISSVNYTFPVEGNFTEEVTLVGSHKAAGGAALAPAATVPGPGAVPNPAVNQDVLRRQNFNVAASTLPSDIADKKLSQVTISADLGREKMFALGDLSPFHRFVNFPLEITASFDVIQDGNAGTNLAGPHFDTVTGNCVGLTGLVPQTIDIYLCDNNGNDTYRFNLGSGCNIQSVSYSGGDTGGGNVTETYTYITYNELTISDLHASAT